MRSTSRAWLAVLLPVLAACGADAGPAGDDGSGAPPGARAIAPAGTSSDGSNPGTGPSSSAPPGALSPALAACIAQPSCTSAGGPELGPKRAFTHTLSDIFAATGESFHRGRDQIYAVGDAQWVIGKMTYSYLDKDLTDEEVDIFVERSCAGSWEKLGTVRTTTNAGLHPTVEGVADDGGRVFFEIPKDKALATGRHRIRLVVAGDLTSTDLVIDIVPKGTQVVVSDVDGTLTDSESAEYPALLSGSLPGAQPHAADALSSLASKGFHVVYLTARPEWLTGRTHEFLDTSGFPRGVVHTTTGLTGALGTAASDFKSLELGSLAAHGHAIAWAFGNQPSDTDAYDAARINPLDHRVFLQLTDAHGGRRIDDYSQILPTLSVLAPICK